MIKHTLKLILLSVCAAALLTLCACNNTAGTNGSSQGANTTGSAQQGSQSKSGTSSIVTEQGELPADVFEEDDLPTSSTTSSKTTTSKTQTTSSTASKTASSTSPFITGSGENALPIIPLK